MKIYLDKELTREATIKNVDGVESVFDGNVCVGAYGKTRLYYDCKEEREEIGKQLKSYRDKVGISIYALSPKTDITKANIARYEQGACSVGLDQLVRLGSILGFHVELVPNEQ